MYYVTKHAGCDWPQVAFPRYSITSKKTQNISSIQSLDRLGGHDRRFSRDPLPVFSAGGPCEQFWQGQICPLFDVVHPAFPLLTTMSLTLQGALKDGFGKAVMACDMTKPCKLLFLGSCQKRFLWTHKGVDLALHPVVGLVLQVGDTEKFPHAPGFERLAPFTTTERPEMIYQWERQICSWHEPDCEYEDQKSRVQVSQP